VRIVFATHRFWPLTTPTIGVLDVVARDLAGRGHAVTILTSQWERHWPTDLVVRDLRVLRFGMDAWNPFSRKMVGQRMASWLWNHRQDWEILVLVEGVEGSESLFQVADRLGRPCLVHFVETGQQSSCGQLLDRLRDDNAASRRGGSHRRQAWRRRDRWLTSDPAVAEDLHRINPLAQVWVWNLGIPQVPPPEAKTREDLRQAMRQVLPRSGAQWNGPVIVSNGPYLQGHDSRWLWMLVSRLVARQPELTIWLAGDGPAVPGLNRLAHEAGLEDRLLFPGCYWDPADLATAADLLLLPQQQQRQMAEWMIAVGLETPCLVSASSLTDWVQQRLRSQASSHSADIANTVDLEAWPTILPPETTVWEDVIENCLADLGKARRIAAAQRQQLQPVLDRQATLIHYEQILAGQAGAVA